MKRVGTFLGQLSHQFLFVQEKGKTKILDSKARMQFTKKLFQAIENTTAAYSTLHKHFFKRRAHDVAKVLRNHGNFFTTSQKDFFLQKCYMALLQQLFNIEYILQFYC